MSARAFVLSLSTAFVFTAFGCDSDNGDDANGNGQSTDDVNNNASWLERIDTPESDYKPSELETVINDIVSELNKTDKNATMKLAFVPKDLADYFETTILGANHAFRELSVVSNIVAPTPGDDEYTEEVALAQQIEIVDKQTANGINGLGLAPHNDSLIPSVDAAIDAGATVITFDTDIPDSKRQLYVGTMNAEAGKTSGETMVSLLEGETGTVIILGNDNAVWIDGYDRTHEARKVIEEAGNTVVIRQTTWADLESDGVFIAETIDTADPPVVGCLGVFSNSHYCAWGAEQAGAIDDIKVAAFDFESETLEYMEAGKIQVTHAQRQYYMGYLIPYLLYAANVLGLEETKTLAADLMVDDERIDTGLDIIYADKVDEYNQFLDDLGVL